MYPCDVEPLTSKNFKDLTMKSEVKYIFPTSSSGVSFHIYQLPEGLGMRKILPHGIRIQSNPQTREKIFRIVTAFHRVMRVQSLTCTIRTEISSMASLTRKLSIAVIIATQRRIRKTVKYLRGRFLQIYLTTCS